MRKIVSLAFTVPVLVMFLAGCGKGPDASTQRPPEQGFNLVQFFKEFETAQPEQKILAGKTWKAIQSDSFPDALKYLGQLEASPALNDAQKKSVADVIGQVQKQMAASPQRL